MDLLTTTNDRPMLVRASVNRRGSRAMKKELANLLERFPAETFEMCLKIHYDESDNSLHYVIIPVSKATGLEEDEDLVVLMDQFPGIREDLRETGQLQEALESLQRYFQQKMETAISAFNGSPAEITVVCN